MEFIEFFPVDNMSAIGLERGTQFGTKYDKEPIEFINGDWASVDEVSEQPVGIF